MPNVHAPYRWIPSYLGLCALVAGTVNMALEITVGRFMTPYLGGSVYTWGALISASLAGMTLGYLMGGWLADRWPNLAGLPILMGLSGLVIAAVPFYGRPVMATISALPADVRWLSIMGAAVLVVPGSVTLAAIPPFCLRLWIRTADRAGSVGGRISALGTLGSIVGTLGTSFYLIPAIGVQAILALLSTLCCAVAAPAMLALTVQRAAVGFSPSERV